MVLEVPASLPLIRILHNSKWPLWRIGHLHPRKLVRLRSVCRTIGWGTFIRGSSAPWMEPQALSNDGEGRILVPIARGIMQP